MGAFEARVREGRQRLEGTAAAPGGWGYVPGGPVFVEPTALALLALAPGLPPDPPSPLKGEGCLPRGLKRLLSCQSPAGCFGAFPEDPDPSWATSVALLALAAHGHQGNVRLAATWLAGLRAPKQGHDAASRQEIREVLHIDVALGGWPWFGDTSAWVEPTALACLALTTAPVPGAAARVAEGLRYLQDRRIPGGGWNYGNPHAFGHDLYALPIPTAKAILALAGAGAAAAVPGEALDQLEALLAQNPSRRAQAWGALALRAAGRQAAAEAAAARAVDSGDGRGPFGAGPDATALAVLALRSLGGEAPAGLVVAAPPAREASHGT